jgi:hypothetical protein
LPGLVLRMLENVSAERIACPTLFQVIVDVKDHLL